MECCLCHRDLPKEAFPLKYGRVRYKSCRECHALGHSCLRPEPKPKRPKLTPEEKVEHRRQYMQEYRRKYRERKKKQAEAQKTSVCTECGKEFPLSEFLDSLGRRIGSGRCSECRARSRANMREYQREYQREYRAANRDKVREFSRESNRRRRGGEEKRKSGPKEGSEFVKQDFEPPRPSTFPLGKKKPAKVERTCEKCVNWPCFVGIENLETDFAKEGCHGWFPRGEVS